MNNRKITKIVIIITILIIAALGFWYFFMGAPGGGAIGIQSPGSYSGFQPFNRTAPYTGNNQNGTGTSTNEQGNGQTAPASLPILRLLSDTPVGGYGASTTASTTVVRWVDRGNGDVYQAQYDSPAMATLSNTIVPRVYESAWNADLSAFIGSIFQDGDASPSAIYAQLLPRSVSSTTDASSSTASVTPYALRGKNLPASIVSFAASPDGKQVFLFGIQNGKGLGYVAPFNGGSASEIFSTPLTQVNVAWPAPNVITVTTKGSASENGYMYFVDPKTGIWTRELGPLPGLSAVASHDGAYILASATGNNNNVVTFIYDARSGTSTDAIVRTLADKCAWGNFYKDVVYCAVPSQPVSGTYPDDWYKGTLSTVDKIWSIDASTDEVHLLSNLVSQSDRVIDAFNLGLDKRDDYLFFMNKNDLSLWSLDLVRSQ